jgi:membrane-associated phospholipid phosphatase
MEAGQNNYIQYNNNNNIDIQKPTIIIDGIGFYAPYLLFLTTILYSWTRKVYLMGYLVFFTANTLLNKLLKLTFREHRPTDYQIFADFEKTTGEEIFGMPSGHAQSVSFSIIFLYLLTNSMTLFLITTFIGSICIYQRWKYRRHTIKQLVIGTFIGAIFGRIAYYLITKHLKTKTQIQPQIQI